MEENKTKAEATKEKKPAKVEATKEEKPAKAEPAKEEKPAKAEPTKEEKPAKVEATKEEKPAKEEKATDNTIFVKVGRAAMKRHGLKEVYVTSDGQAFAQKGNANSHARNLENKEVITVK